MTYKSRPQLFVPSERDPVPHRNSGWRRNMRNWQKLFDYPKPSMRRLLACLKKFYPKYNLKVIVFDPHWHGRQGECVDGSPLMFTAELLKENGSNCYIDLQLKRPGANRNLYQAKAEYCKRNNIDLIIMNDDWTSMDMEWELASLFLQGRTNKETP